MKNFFYFLSRVCLTITLLIFTTSVFGYTVASLTATYKSGQVFLTWQNPAATNLKYKLYRSPVMITSSLDLAASTYLGYVRDNSSQNIRKSNVKRLPYYFTIDPASGPLASTNGLYVATSASSSNWYYAVTVVTLSNNQEDQTIIAGSNSLNNGVNEVVATPQPILQKTTSLEGGIVQYEYVNWGDNQNAPNYPPFNNAGSYGYNFSVFTKGSYTNKSLYFYVKDNNPLSSDATTLCDNCISLKMDDWLPNGSNTYWVGYNTGYDMYSTTNPVFSSGSVGTYSQARVRQTLLWIRKNFPVDTNKVYLTGNSHNGFGALFLAVMNPDLITVAYASSAPILVKSAPGSSFEREWCSSVTNVPSDVIDFRTGIAIPIWNLMDMRYMYRLNYDRGVPYLTGVNGKNDTKVGWVGKFHWYDSVNVTHQGGLWFWDQRQHSGTNRQFTDIETTPNYERFTMAHSYPAFAYCSINQNPGTGDSKNGDANGALDGYLDWTDESIADQSCQYSIYCFVKDMYMGGILYPKQYDSCTTDITLRHLQLFKPLSGQTISWSVNNNGQTVQSGNFLYQGGCITVKGVKIFRSGSSITLTIDNCLKSVPAEAGISAKAKVIITSSGYYLLLDLPETDPVQMKIFDLMGRMVNANNYYLEKGRNSIPIQTLTPGLYIAIAESRNFRETVKFAVTR
ncbi:MAG: T9SS type A sorting domain-containing protein [Chitinophagales bacterium]|nr:T9SS type A sorting domain-containing protein [Chitinophagales bacterium]